jgi:metal-responsive CopG/Arc/MetJ family transcriptional regulator
MKNIQITVDEQTLRRVDRVSKPLGLKRSAIVRQALREWLDRRAVQSFEAAWVGALTQRPDTPDSAEDWRSVQAWDRK